jgi:putative transposase
VGLGRVPGQRVAADARPRAARHALPQAVRAPAPSRPGRGRDRAFQKSFPARLDAVAGAAGVDPDDVEVWFGDQARVGQKNKVTRRWARRGTRPVAPRDQRTASTYIFGAICPEGGKAAGLVLPRCNTEAMGLHRAAISEAVAPGRHAALLVDRAGWHTSAKLQVPDNITLVPLPAKCPELNPQENVWRFMRENWLSNRVFSSYEDLLDHCCDAWNRLVEQPWRIMSLGLRHWAYEY